MQKNWASIIVVFCVAVLVFAGVLAFANQADENKTPMVPVNYMQSVLSPDMQSEIEAFIITRTDAIKLEMENRLAEFSATIDSKLAGVQSPPSGQTQTPPEQNTPQDTTPQVTTPPPSSSSSQSGSFVLVDVAVGKTLTLGVGAEVLLRIGDATVAIDGGGGPALIDMTTGAELADGATLEKNHHYLCTIDKRLIKPTSALKIFVRGTYTVA